MRSWLLIPALLLAGAGAAAAETASPAVNAKSWERATLRRDWRNPYGPMTANMSLWLTRRVRQPNGSYREERFTAWLRLDVRLNFAQLRAGEEEEFEVHARDYGFSGDDPIVNLDLRPIRTYYYYYPQQRNIVVRNTGSVWETLYAQAGPRMRVGAPATVDKMSVSLTQPTSPVTFSWRDYGAQDNPGATTEYRFRVGRAKTFGNDVVVAEGELGSNAGVVLTPDSPYAQGHAEYFQQGEKYRLVVWMRRKGSDVYSEEWGPAEWGTFTFRQGTGSLAAGALATIPLPRQERFEALYRGR